MATKADFSEDEWKTMQKGITGAGMLVSVSDRDFTDTFGEASALSKYLSSQRESGASDLMRELAHAKGTGFGFTDSPQEIETETLEALRSSVATLAAKASDEVDAYRQLVLGIGAFVAEAKGGVTDVEAATIAKLEEALGRLVAHRPRGGSLSHLDRRRESPRCRVRLAGPESDERLAAAKCVRRTRHRLDSEPATLHRRDVSGEHHDVRVALVDPQRPARSVGTLGDDAREASVVALEVRVAIVELRLADSLRGAVIELRAFDRDRADRDAAIIRAERRPPRHQEHDVVDRLRSQRQIRVRATSVRTGRSPHVRRRRPNREAALDSSYSISTSSEKG